jgi:hypothetical protein
MKTIREWIEICKIAQPEIGQQWEKHLDCSNSKAYIHMQDAMCASFTWYETTEGADYWNDIYEDMSENTDKYSIPKRKLFNKV